MLWWYLVLMDIDGLYLCAHGYCKMSWIFEFKRLRGTKLGPCVSQGCVESWRAVLFVTHSSLVGKHLIIQHNSQVQQLELSADPLSKTVNMAGKVSGQSQKQICHIFDSAVDMKGKHILLHSHWTQSLNCFHLAAGSGPRGASQSIYNKYYITCDI